MPANMLPNLDITFLEGQNINRLIDLPCFVFLAYFVRLTDIRPRPIGNSPMTVSVWKCACVNHHHCVNNHHHVPLHWSNFPDYRRSFSHGYVNVWDLRKSIMQLAVIHVTITQIDVLLKLELHRPKSRQES